MLKGSRKNTVPDTPPPSVQDQLTAANAKYEAAVRQAEEEMILQLKGIQSSLPRHVVGSVARSAQKMAEDIALGIRSSAEARATSTFKREVQMILESWHPEKGEQNEQ